ncbi:hypothetical protein DKX38_019737 [Salix brachista]|uniref:Uncharacterized protein n=1 Tax=Salix brachista TaxID=2182728 RepID=A0A5N5KHC9_9ROSI|nr:hypothetical protein DKX38_019737 [Salix brachista]
MKRSSHANGTLGNVDNGHKVVGSIIEHEDCLSDGQEVTVDNKFLMANNPHLDNYVTESRKWSTDPPTLSDDSLMCLKRSKEVAIGESRKRLKTNGAITNCTISNGGSPGTGNLWPVTRVQLLDVASSLTATAHKRDFFMVSLKWRPVFWCKTGK